MRWLAILSPLVVTGCASAPKSSQYAASVIPIHTPPQLQRPWLLQAPADEVTLFDTRILNTVRKVPASAAQNDTGEDAGKGGGKAAVKVGLWVGVATRSRGRDSFRRRHQRGHPRLLRRRLRRGLS